MRLFRSEDHVDEWVRAGNPRGEIMTIEQQWALARRWFAGRHLPGWRKRTAGEAMEIFRSLGLTSPFWALD